MFSERNNVILNVPALCDWLGKNRVILICFKHWKNAV